MYSYFNHKVEDRGSYTNGWAIAATGITNTATLTAVPNPTDQKSSRLGASYAFPMGLKVGLGWDRSTMTSNTAGLGDRTRTAWMLPIGYTMGNHTFHFNYAKAGNTSGVAANANGSTDTSASEYMLAYGYNFTKRTSVGVQYINLRTGQNASSTMAGASVANNGQTGNTVGEDAKLWSFNMRHFF